MHIDPRYKRTNCAPQSVLHTPLGTYSVRRKCAAEAQCCMGHAICAAKESAAMTESWMLNGSCSSLWQKKEGLAVMKGMIAAELSPA